MKEALKELGTSSTRAAHHGILHNFGYPGYNLQKVNLHRIKQVCTPLASLKGFGDQLIMRR